MEMEKTNEKQTVIDNLTNIQNNDMYSSNSDDEPEINYRGVKAMPFIIGNETFEKLGAMGTLANLLVYLTTVFNMKSITAAILLNVFHGTTNLATLLGAFLCDAYFGRYKTLIVGTFASFLGLFMIALTATFKNLHPPHCTSKNANDCIGPTLGQMAFLLAGFGFMVIGAGGIRPCNLAFGADQFNPKTESGKRGIDSFFNWYFFTLTFAIMVSLTGIVYVQSSVSWAIGLGIPAGFMLISLVLFLMGSSIYVKVKPEGSPFTSIVQVFVVAIKKRRFVLPKQPSVELFNYMPPKSINSKLPLTETFRFLNKAAIMTSEDGINQDGSSTDPWKLCSIQQIEEIKCVLRVLPIWASGIIYSIVMSPQQTYVVFQALQSNRHFAGTKFQIPAASYPIFVMISLTIFVPIYDRIIVPTLRRVTHREGGITILQRMGIGVGLSVVTSIVAGGVENWRRALAMTRPTLGYEAHRGEISSMQALWLAPQLTIAGLSEAFMIIGQLEFYYKQFPENMRSVGSSFLFCGMAVSSYVSGFLVSFIDKVTEQSDGRSWLANDLNKGKLDYYYYLVTSFGVINMGFFLVCSKWYRYKGTEDIVNNIEMEKKQQLDKALV